MVLWPEGWEQAGAQLQGRGAGDSQRNRVACLQRYTGWAFAAGMQPMARPGRDLGLSTEEQDSAGSKIGSGSCESSQEVDG